MSEPGPGAAPIRVVVADDQVLLRSSLGLLVDAEPDLTLAGEAGDGRAALDVVRRERPDVVLMDIRMPELDGLQATRRICADPELSGVRVCILTMFELDEYVYAALRHGASGFLLKDTPPEMLLGAIRRIHSGESLLSPPVLARVLGHYLRTPPTRPAAVPPAGLTRREVEVLTLVGRGLTNAEIEAALSISRGTMKSHVAHLLAKLGARDRVQLVIAAYEARLVTPSG